PGGAPLADCQAAIADAGIALLAAETHALERCWEDRARGRHANACPSPGDGKAAPELARAADALRTAVCRACGGPDGTCDGSADLSPSAIGFVGTCPALDVAGG